MGPKTEVTDNKHGTSYLSLGSKQPTSLLGPNNAPNIEVRDNHDPSPIFNGNIGEFNGTANIVNVAVADLNDNNIGVVNVQGGDEEQRRGLTDNVRPNRTIEGSDVGREGRGVGREGRVVCAPQLVNTLDRREGNDGFVTRNENMKMGLEKLAERNLINVENERYHGEKERIKGKKKKKSKKSSKSKALVVRNCNDDVIEPDQKYSESFSKSSVDLPANHNVVGYQEYSGCNSPTAGVTYHAGVSHGSIDCHAPNVGRMNSSAPNYSYDSNTACSALHKSTTYPTLLTRNYCANDGVPSPVFSHQSTNSSKNLHNCYNLTSNYVSKSQNSNMTMNFTEDTAVSSISSQKSMCSNYNFSNSVSRPPVPISQMAVSNYPPMCSEVCSKEQSFPLFVTNQRGSFTSLVNKCGPYDPPTDAHCNRNPKTSDHSNPISICRSSEVSKYPTLDSGTENFEKSVFPSPTFSYSSSGIACDLYSDNYLRNVDKYQNNSANRSDNHIKNITSHNTGELHQMNMRNTCKNIDETRLISPSSGTPTYNVTDNTRNINLRNSSPSENNHIPNCYGNNSIHSCVSSLPSVASYCNPHSALTSSSASHSCKENCAGGGLNTNIEKEVLSTLTVGCSAHNANTLSAARVCHQDSLRNSLVSASAMSVLRKYENQIAARNYENRNSVRNYENCTAGDTAIAKLGDPCSPQLGSDWWNSQRSHLSSSNGPTHSDGVHMAVLGSVSHLQDILEEKSENQFSLMDGASQMSDCEISCNVKVFPSYVFLLV